MQIKDKAILLSKTKYAEADLILKLLTAGGEVYSAIAKSALKSRKRFGGGVLEPTHYVNVSLTRRPDDFAGERLAVLNEAQMIDDFRGLKADYDRLALALFFVQTVATMAREGDMHREIFNLLGHALKAAEMTNDLTRLRTQFVLKLLHLQGVLPPEPQYLPYLKASIRESQLIDVGDVPVSQQADLILQRYLTL